MSTPRVTTLGRASVAAVALTLASGLASRALADTTAAAPSPGTPALAPAAPRTYAIDAVHSNIGYSIRHVVSQFRGRFGAVEGTLSVTPGNLAATRGTVAVPVASVDTANEKRDGHLRSPDFFDAENHPEMKYVIESVEPTGESSATVRGQLTLRGVTKPVELKAEDIAFAGPLGKGVLGFHATGKLDRKDFGVAWNRALEAGNFVLGDEVKIVLDIEAKEVPPASAPQPAG